MAFPFAANLRRACKRHSKKRFACRTNSTHELLSSLGLPSWQQQVYGLILARSYQTADCAFHERDTKQHALRLLDKLEHLERIALVKLAVWKGQCLSNPSDEIKTYFDYSDWTRRGWKESKETFKDNSAMGIIVDCLAPFLTEKDEEEEDEEEEEHYYVGTVEEEEEDSDGSIIQRGIHSGAVYRWRD